MYYRSKRNKTAEYLAYQNEIRDELEGTSWPFSDWPVAFYVEAGFSNRAADIDNVIKPLLDTLQNTYEEFNDNKVYYCELHKRIVPKGEEYIWIRVGTYGSGLFQTAKSQADIEGKQEAGLSESKQET